MKKKDFTVITNKSDRKLSIETSKEGILKNLSWLIILSTILMPAVIASIAYDIIKFGKAGELTVYFTSIAVFLIGASVLINIIKPYKISLIFDEKTIHIQKKYIFRNISHTFSIFDFGEIIFQTKKGFFLIIMLKESIALAFRFRSEKELKNVATEIRQFIKRHKKN